MARNNIYSGMIPDLEKFLTEVPRHVRPPREQTLFSLGGRGHYEEPVSDLLAFFFRPGAEHGMGNLFLTAFFDCLERSGVPHAKEAGQLTFDRTPHTVTAEREVTTPDGKAIDLLVQCSDWTLVIEAKAYSPHYNPFSSYEKHARSLNPQATLFLAILSPGGTSAAAGWTGVKYSDYCQAVRRRFSGAWLDRPYSKWQVFAREFILHLENEFSHPPMTEDAAGFVEKHEGRIAEVKTLERDYISFLREQVQLALESAVPGRNFTTRHENWPLGPCIRCNSGDWQSADIAFWRHEGVFTLVVYLPKQTEPERIISGKHFVGMNRSEEREWDKWISKGYPSRDDALAELNRLTPFVDRLATRHPTLPPAPLDPVKAAGPR